MYDSNPIKKGRKKLHTGKHNLNDLLQKDITGTFSWRSAPDLFRTKAVISFGIRSRTQAAVSAETTIERIQCFLGAVVQQFPVRDELPLAFH